MINRVIPDVEGRVLPGKSFGDMSLPELLQARKTLVQHEKDIKKMKDGKNLYKFAVARLQHWIYHRRTHRKSGLIIPYSNEVMTD